MRKHRNFARLALLSSGAITCIVVGTPAFAQETSQELDQLRILIQQQAQRLDEQDERLAQQEAELTRLRTLIATDPNLLASDDLVTLRGRGVAIAAQAVTPESVPASQDTPPVQPVGEAPPEEISQRPAVAAVPQEQGVLSRPGLLVIEPSFQYVNSANDRLVFRGFELVPGIQIGLIEASRARRDTLIETIAVRYGLSSRLEIEARVPLLYRNDRISVAQQREQGIVREINLSESGVGDAEFSVRYQLNHQRGQRPIWVGGLRVKSDTGKGPFDIGYDEFGVATGLTTGSGFWGIQPSISMLLPSDPVVIFGGVSYLYNIGRDIDRVVGGAPIGHVDPGDSISGSLGFGFALNPRFSFSLGYRHNYIMPTETEIGGAVERSDRLQVGSLTFGMSYRLTERVTANASFEFGVTEDAPDLGVTLRFPITF
ncbi:transporter [Qipengyuania spongiae]|uniref:Transporter n=1 Tax=Qipengyuania spongiae TaxID=2909673 RepID=A0ABY5T0E9_9SPHN|nr:transporter [Qipengyuania spongiae]UVI39581.1 hypothetical protein L1F33_01035 [Qipengyuania spongiae]